MPPGVEVALLLKMKEGCSTSFHFAHHLPPLAIEVEKKLHYYFSTN